MAPIELPEAEPSPPPAPPVAAPPDGEESSRSPTAVLAPARPGEVTYVPLAVTIGDGFKFGCGFFLALVVVMLIGFVLLAALFVVTSLFGVSLPLTR